MNTAIQSESEMPKNLLTDLSVLLIEDDEDDYLLTVDLLDEVYGKGYSLTWLSDASSVISQLKSKQPDICLVDFQLGASTGIELIELMQTEGFSRIPTILLTGMNSHELDVEATNVGATDYLVKSQLDGEKLERSIRYALHQKEVESQVRHLAYHDPLTEIANRALFTEHLERAISVAQRHGDYGALLFIDLDNFKSVNDSLGHSVGDELIIEISQRLQNSIRSEDVVARFGGDEFVILLSRLSDNADTAKEMAENISEKLRLKVNEPMTLSDNEVRVGCSMGIAMFSDCTTSGENLMKQADMAMYTAKEEGKNAFCFFEARMEESANTSYWVEQELHQALEQDQFELHYQPVFGLPDQQIIGCEALIRWRHPTRGLILPDQFISIAEQGSVICGIGKFVITEACKYLDQLSSLPSVDINIGAKHFDNDVFVDDLLTSLESTGVDPCRLIIELTESDVLKNIRLARDKMILLREIGFRFALDDFGTGYSSLSVLRDLPFDYLKIDKSFIFEIGKDPSNDAITQAIIAMSRILGMKVIAEGVETSEQLDFLLEHSCEAAQGYWFSQPLPAAEFIASLDKFN